MLRSDELRIDKGVISEQASSASLRDHLLEHGIRHAAVQLQRCVKIGGAAHHLFLTCARGRAGRCTRTSYRVSWSFLIRPSHALLYSETKDGVQAAAGTGVSLAIVECPSWPD